jgi:protein-S-isoprenylcysteine O-methyltransferase Ste14
MADDGHKAMCGRLRGPGIAVLVGTFLGPAIEGALLFVSAGTVALPRAWLFLVLSLFGMGGGIALVGLHNPELLNHRGQWKKKKDAKPWDRALVPLYGVLAFYVLPIVMGLDVGRYGWSHLGAWAAAVGALLFVAGSVVLTWAMLVNTHFETIVRIQTDRDHKVVTKGPYALVRHPGYVGASLWALGTPLIVGSAYGLIAVALTVITLVVRTALEDRTLHAELAGYADYAAQTKHRLLPRIW